MAEHNNITENDPVFSAIKDQRIPPVKAAVFSVSTQYRRFGFQAA